MQNKVEILTLPNFKIYCKATVINRYRHKKTIRSMEYNRV